MSVNFYDKTNDRLDLISGGITYAFCPIGTILSFGGAIAPKGYLLCDGSEVSKTEYSELYNVIGDSFGTASGSGMFKLPDLRESVPKGAGLTGHTVGAHLDADGLAVGEFLDDRVQNITGKLSRSGIIGAGGAFYGSGSNYNANLSSGSIDGSKYDIYFDASRIVRAGNTTEVKSVGVNYIIKAKVVSNETDVQQESDRYSTDEVDTGKRWIDGKKIYRKCFTGAIATYTDSGKRRLFQSDVLLSDVSDIVSIGGSCTFNTDPTSISAQWVKIGSTWVNTELTPVYVVNIIKSSTDARLYGACDQNTVLTKLTYKLVVEYTKT